MSKYQSGIHGGLEAVPAKDDYPERLQKPDNFEAQAARKEVYIEKPLPERNGASFSTQYSHGSEIKSEDRKSGKARAWRKTTIVLAVLLTVMTVVAIAIGAAFGMQKSRTSRYVDIQELLAIIDLGRDSLTIFKSIIFDESNARRPKCLLPNIFNPNKLEPRSNGPLRRPNTSSTST
jgi:hypothetical protein